MAVKRINKVLIDAMKPGELFWDSNLTGFGVRRLKSQKSFLIKYGTGRRERSRWVTIGKHGGPWVDDNGKPCTLTAELARKEALRLLGEKARGNDPAAKRDRARSMPTLAEFSARYIEEHAVPHKKERSAKEDRRLLKRNILPVLGRIRIDHLTRADVLRFHNGRKAHPTNANRCLALLSHICTMAEKWGLRPDRSNAARHVPKFKENKRKRFLSEAELGRLAVALADAEKENPFAIAAIRLLAFTGARRNEVLTLRWEDVHLDRGVLELADSKTGAKPIYLNAPSVQLLASLPRLSGNPWVFPGRVDGGHLVNVSKLWNSIRDEAEIPDVRLNDLRHGFASVLVSGGASLPLIGGLLGHASAETTKRYAHLSDDPLRAASERAGEVIVAAMRRGQKKGAR